MMRPLLAATVIALVALAFAGAGTIVDAHRTAVSPYTYHRDVLPIFESKCGRCHGEAGVSGVPLLRYVDARQVTWPLRQALARGHMPPWFASSGSAFKSSLTLTARELNILMTWATGGGPEGTPTASQAPAAGTGWPLGRPDLILTMPADFAFEANQLQRIHEVALPSKTLRGRVVRVVDLLPGTAAIVRRAEIVSRSRAGERIIALWQPGDEPAPLDANAGFRIDRDATLVLKMHYRRTSHADLRDRSQVGIYFAGGRAAAVESMDFAPESDRPSVQPIDRRIRAVAVRPVSGPAGTAIQLTVVRPDGSRAPLARVQIQPDWERRYAFTRSITIQAGDRIEGRLEPSANPVWSSLTGDTSSSDTPAARITLEYVR